VAVGEPSRRGSCDFLGTGSRTARSSNEPIRAHEQRAEAKAILGVAPDVPDMVAPKAIERLAYIRRFGETASTAEYLYGGGVCGPTSSLNVTVD
jgi:hypothetical protein